jgi:hypothetical protein
VVVIAHGAKSDCLGDVAVGGDAITATLPSHGAFVDAAGATHAFDFRGAGAFAVTAQTHSFVANVQLFADAGSGDATL